MVTCTLLDSFLPGGGGSGGLVCEGGRGAALLGSSCFGLGAAT